MDRGSGCRAGDRADGRGGLGVRWEGMPRGGGGDLGF